MFDAVRGNKRIVQILLVLISVPFALWGVESYVGNVGGGSDAAEVGDSRISPAELSQALRDQQERMRATLGREFNAAMFDTPEMRQIILDSLINKRVLLLQAARSRLTVGDDQLREFIGAIPALQEDGKFSRPRYETALRGQGLTEAGFEARLRQDLLLQQMSAPVGEGAFIAHAASDRWLAVQQEEREISEFVVRPEAFVEQVKLAPDAEKNYYESNRKQFELPEQVRAEYLVLSPDALAESVAVGETEIKAYFDAHQERYRQSEERRASHILIQVARDAGEAEVTAARARIEELAKQVKQNPNEFARLAEQHSQDTGSAKNGGDLGFFGRGAMVKPFEDTVFSLKENEVSGIVRSDFGFHIIKLTGLKGEKTRTLDEVRNEIAAELRRQGAGRKYAEAAEAFSNIVYEQADSLKPAADKFKLAIRYSEWVSKGEPRSAGLLGNDKLLASLFSEDAIKNKRNTEAIEVAQNTLISARVLEHKPATMRPLEAVSAEIKKKLILDEAAKLAQKEGEEKVARLAKGEKVEVPWGAPRAITRQGDAKVPAAVRSIFKLGADKLPAYTGTDMPGGAYLIYKVISAKQPSGKNDALAKAIRSQYERLRAEDDFAAYLAAVKERFPVTVNRAALESKER